MPSPLDVIWFEDARKDLVQAYLKTEARQYSEALEYVGELIDGFESPFGMELLATVDWLLTRENAEPTVTGIRQALGAWPEAGAGLQLHASCVCSMIDRLDLHWSA